MKYNICWECGNACANKCEWVRSERPIKGWTAEHKKDRYLVHECPNFVTDGFIGVQNIAKAIGWTDRMIFDCIKRGRADKVIEHARKMGYAYSCYESKDGPAVHLLVPLNQKRGLDSYERV